MARNPTMGTTGGMTTEPTRTKGRGETTNGGSRHEHRTAKVVELIGTSTESFEAAIETVLKDASETTRGITGAHVENMSVACENGRIISYQVNLKVAFGIERTGRTG